MDEYEAADIHIRYDTVYITNPGCGRIRLSCEFGR